MMLSSDCERVIKLEVAYNIRFIIRDTLDEKFIKQNFIRLVEAYISEDDLFLKTEIFISVMMNFKKYNDDVFISGITQKIANLIENNSNISDFGHIIKIFDFLIIENESLIKSNVAKNLYNIIKLFIKVKIIKVYIFYLLF